MANNNIPIIKLKESDIISQSMNIINQNFDTIVNNYDIANFKWEQYSKKITDEIEKVKNYCKNSNIDIARSVDSLNTRIDNITDLNDIQTQINNAIMNANEELTGFISDLAGKQVANVMGGYVKTSTLDNKLKDYVASSAFDTYKSDAKNRMASSSLIVANSKFATIKDNGVDYLMNLDGTKSIYKNTEEYWNAIKDTIDPTGKGLEDEEIFNNFLQKCEETFRTVSTELANISTKVGPGSSQVDIIATVKNELGKTSSGDAKDITAAIFARATQYGSEIQLSANNIQLSAEKKLNLSTGTFTIDSQNLKLDENGDVRISGDLVAKTLATSNGKTRIDSNGILHAQGADIQGTITADKFVAESTKLISIPYQATETEKGYYEGNVTKRTSINSDEFVIETSGVLEDTFDGGHGTPIDVTGNKLYIKIVDKLVNNNDDIKDLSGQKVDYLYGVPVLCMMYNGVEYPLSPASWYKEPVISGNPTNMYFLYIEDTYSSVTSKGGSNFFFNPQNSYNSISLSPCKKYKFAYDLGGGDAEIYLPKLSTASLINEKNEGITTIDVSPSGLIKTSQSVGKITIDDDNISLFRPNLKTPLNIYQKFTDSNKMYFGDFSRIPYNGLDVDSGTPDAGYEDVNTVPCPDWFNDSIFAFLNDSGEGGFGDGDSNWGYEGGDLNSYNLNHAPQFTNPFNTGITGGICGSISSNILGYYRKYYEQGFESDDSNPNNGFAECTCEIYVYFLQPQNYTVSLDRTSGGTDTFYMTNMYIRIAFDKYESSTSKSSLINALKSGNIGNLETVGEKVHIEAYIDCSSQPGVIGYNSIALVYSNN